MAGQHGIKETKEAISGAMKLGGLLYASFKDGVQAQDVVVIWDKIKADPVLQQALIEAYNQADQIPLEVKELSIGESVELATHILAEGAKLFQQA